MITDVLLSIYIVQLSKLAVRLSRYIVHCHHGRFSAHEKRQQQKISVKKRSITERVVALLEKLRTANIEHLSQQRSCEMCASGGS